MLYDKAQKECFAALMRGNRVVGCEDGKGNVVVTPDGCKAFIFPLSIVAFSLEKVLKPADALLGCEKVIKPDNEIMMTPFTRDAREFGRNERIRILDNHGENVYAKESFFAYWHAPRFYQERGKPLEKIVVAETIPTGGINPPKYAPVGFFLPIRADFRECIREQEECNDG